MQLKEFSIDHLCWPTGVSLEKGRHYTLWIEMIEPFFDQTIMTDIAGFRDSSPGRLMPLLIRRWWAADWFQPIARIGAAGNTEWPLEAADGAEALPIGRDAKGQEMPARFQSAGRLDSCDPIPGKELAVAQALHRKQNLRRTYVSQFQAEGEGELFLYVNDAIAAIPYGPTIKCFYANNSGVAKVTIERTPAPKPTTAPMPTVRQ